MGNEALKAYKGMGMEGMVAKWYAANAAKTMNQFEALARQVAKDLGPTSSVLEVAPGPGYFAIALAKCGDYRITGLDISETFVAIARKNALQAHVTVDFQVGNASAMPFGAGSFDFLLCRAAFKNFSEPVAALREMHRVLRPGGKALIIDLRRDASQESIDQEVAQMGLNPLSALFTRWVFRFTLLKRAYTGSEFEAMIAEGGFRRPDIRRVGVGFDIWLER
jgi:ubiquinone/menaquinone biosynthesis C-methylase UbiE